MISLQFLLYPMEQSPALNICSNLFWCPAFNKNVTSNTDVPKTNQTSIWMITVSVHIHVSDGTKKRLHFRVPSFSRRVLVWSRPHRHGVSASLQVHTASSNFVTTALNHTATRFEQKIGENNFLFVFAGCSVDLYLSHDPSLLWPPPSLRPNCIPFSPPLLVFLPPHPRPSIISHFCPPHPWWTAPQLLFSVFPSFLFILLDVLLPCRHVPPPPPPSLSSRARDKNVFIALLILFL